MAKGRRRARREDIPFSALKVPFWLPGLLVVAAAVGFIATGNVHLLGLEYFPPYPVFSDLRQVTSTADCLMANPQWSPVGATCDPWGRAYNYPMAWARAFAWLGWGGSRTDAIGYGLIGCYGLFALLLSRQVLTRARGMAAVVFTLSVVAPPALYLLVRGNIDSVVLLLLAAFVALVAAERAVLSIVVLALASALKIFPAFGWMGLFALSSRPRRWALVGAFAIVGALALEGPDILRAARDTPQVVHWAFGASVVPQNMPWLERLVPGPAPVVGLVALTGVILLVWVLDRGLAFVRSRRPSTSRLLHAATEDRLAKLLLYTGSGLIVLTYVVGSSFDYRLQVLTFVVGGLCLLWREWAARVLVVAILAVQYFSFTLGSPADQVSEVLLMVVVGYLAIVLLEALWRELTPGRERRRAELLTDLV
jgi:hypothetical protein